VVDPWAFDPRSFDPKPTAQRFEEGVPNGLGLIGLDAALSLIEEVGIEAMGERVLSLTDRAAELLLAKGYVIDSPRNDAQKSGILMFHNPNMASEDVLKVIEAAGVTASVRGGNVRFAPHFYNTPEEIAEAVAALPE